MERVPSFKRTKSRRARDRLSLEAQDHDILTLIAFDLPFRHKLMLFETCKEFAGLRESAPEISSVIDETHQKWNIALAAKEEQVRRDRRDFMKNMCAAIALAMLSFFAQAGVGMLYIYTYYRTKRLHPGCPLHDFLGIMGWCSVCSWLLGLIVQLVMHVREFRRTMAMGGTAVESTYSKVVPKFDLEAGEPLLEEEVQPEDISNQLKLVFLGIIQCVITGVAIVTLYCGIHAWSLIHYTAEDTLRGQCGDWAYGVSYWCIWFLYTLCFGIWAVACMCMCCAIPIAALVRRFF